MKRVWTCDERESCVYVCAELRADGIPFQVDQRKHQVFWNVHEHYGIWVPAEFYDKAKSIAEHGCVDFSDSYEDEKIMELPDAGAGLVKHDKRNWGWHREDPGVEVWSEKTEERPWYEQVKGLAWMIQLSLHEYGIGTHTNVSQDGFKRIFVRPEDELQAREIVRELRAARRQRNFSFAYPVGWSATSGRCSLVLE